LALVASLFGLHWTLLQSVAWVTMFARFARQDAPLTALAKTFDGQHPCALCHAIEAGKQQEREQSEPGVNPKANVRIEGCPNTSVLQLLPPVVEEGVPEPWPMKAVAPQAPPTPIPRVI
jgi:hypothetical protein